MLNNPLLKKITVWLAPTVLLVLWETWLRFPRAIIEVGILSFLLIAFVIWYLTWRPVAVSELQKKLHHQEFWRFLLTPGIFVLSVWLFLVILGDRLWQQVMVVASCLLLFLILQNLFTRFWAATRYPAQSFESISGNINSVSVFLLATVGYSFSTFLDLPLLVLAIFLLAGTTLLVYQTMWVAGVEIKRSWLYILIVDLIVVELFWVLLFLPNTFYVKGVAITVAYYLAVNLSRNYLINLINAKMVWRYLIVGGIMLVLVLGTAQWL